MIERRDVEALLEEAEQSNGSLSHVDAPTLAALCRAWLAVDEAPRERVREALFADGYRVGKIISTADASLIGQRVRIVPVEGDQ